MRKKKKVLLKGVRVEDYAADGKSLARVAGKVIFIENTIPGDVVDIQLLKNKKDWAEGRVLEIIEPSTLRVEPFCEHFGVCGGCQWQMLPYEKQLEYKHRQIRDNLQRIGKIPLPELLPIIGAEKTRFYRNKIEYTFGNKRFLLPTEIQDPAINAEHDVAGFHARGLFDKVVDIRKCWLQDEPTNELRLAVKDFAKANNYLFYDIKNHSGFLRTMQVRLCTTGEVMVNLVFGEDDRQKREKIMKYLATSFATVTTFLYTINTKKNDSLHDLEPVIYSGKGFVVEKLATGIAGEEYFFKIGPKSFFQTNTWQGEKLYRVTREFAKLTGIETVYDLYCGTGSIGIFLSRASRKIVGVEMIDAAVVDARENARMNNIDSAEFFSGDVSEICNESFFKQHGHPDVIITDPPRAGMSEKLVRSILEIGAPRVVYVSCNPATQARDLALLDEKYSVTRVQPVDMFPHTLHIENVVQLTRKS